MAGTLADETGNATERTFQELMRDLLRARTGHSTLIGATLQKVARKFTPEGTEAVAVGGATMDEARENARRLGDWLDGRGTKWELREDPEAMTVSLIVPEYDAAATEAYARVAGIDAARLAPVVPIVAEGPSAESDLTRLADYLRGSGSEIGAPESLRDAYALDVPRSALQKATAFMEKNGVAWREATDDEAREIGLKGGAAKLFAQLDRDDNPIDWFRGGSAAEASEYLGILRKEGLWAERFDGTVFYRVLELQKVKDAFRDVAERAWSQLKDREASRAAVPTMAEAAHEAASDRFTPGQEEFIRSIAPDEADAFLASDPSKAEASRFITEHGGYGIDRFADKGDRTFEDGMEAVRGKDIGGTRDTPHLVQQTPPAHDSDPSTPWADGSDAPGTGDTDHDGIVDSAEDVDGDGVPDDAEWVPTAQSQGTRLKDRCANAKACAGATPDAQRPEIGHNPETR